MVKQQRQLSMKPAAVRKRKSRAKLDREDRPGQLALRRKHNNNHRSKTEVQDCHHNVLEEGEITEDRDDATKVVPELVLVEVQPRMVDQNDNDDEPMDHQVYQNGFQDQEYQEVQNKAPKLWRELRSPHRLSEFYDESRPSLHPRILRIVDENDEGYAVKLSKTLEYYLSKEGNGGQSFSKGVWDKFRVAEERRGRKFPPLVHEMMRAFSRNRNPIIHDIK